MPTPSPTSPSTAAVPDAGTILHSVEHGAWLAMSSSPWVGVLLGLIVISGLIRCVRSVIHSGHAKDPVRLFGRTERRIILDRAGHRCEHFYPVFGRCRETERLHADHVHPHSRGGWTALSNAQALCARHNREKSARVPWEWQLARLAKRRAGYFRPGNDRVVVRYRPRATKRLLDDGAGRI